MEALIFVFGFLFGTLFSFVLVSFITDIIEKALKKVEPKKDDDDADWWKYPKDEE